MKPDSASHLLQQGIRAFMAGDAGQASACFEQVVREDPNNFSGWNCLGNLHVELGQNDQALVAYGAALRLKKDAAEIHYNLAGVFQKLGRLPEAESHYGEAIRLRPAWSAAHNNLGNLFWQQKRLAEALVAYGNAIRLQPDYPEAHYNQGIIFKETGDLASARDAFLRALSLRPAYSEAWNNLGLVFHLLDDLEKAIACFQRALVLVPGDPQYHDNLGTDLVMLGHRDEGIRCYQEALRLRSDDPEFRLHYGLAVLAQGRWQLGWPFYDARVAGKHPPLDPGVPLWNGESLKDRSILLWAEQGYGDTLMMFRYAETLADQGAAVTVLVPPALVSLLQRGHDRIRVLPNVNAQCLEGRFDFHCPLMSLPRCLGLEPNMITVIDRYLFARPDPRPTGFLEKRLQVGLVWAGNPKFLNDRQRSLPHFKILAPLLGLPGCQFHSLSVGQRINELDGFPVDNPITAAWDFDDTAAYIQHLDLVISVDTAGAHLAGALGKPVWILLPTPAEWRWYPYDETTPWYPSARLFIQKQRGDWDEAISRIAMRLGNIADHKEDLNQ
jgi:tetratricopeptide (TPR) repeat protein